MFTVLGFSFGWLALAAVVAVIDVLDLHGKGGRRIFSPLYYKLLCDATALHRGMSDAQFHLANGEMVAAATGERVWDAQLSSRRLRLAAHLRTDRAGH